MRKFSSYGPVDKDLHYYAPGKNCLTEPSGSSYEKILKKAVIT
ncbi:hypothetical protein QUF80_14440 [Desulfococcaceae bacterium HSG8]|nr:hypothetical protein [Desulfococcaceae bacterium HSG8]